jgi:hypothetical protein
MSINQNNKADDIKILICTHKAAEFPQENIFLPVLGGGWALASKEPGIQYDDTGENISAKNKNFAEITVLYWAWKNLPPKLS